MLEIRLGNDWDDFLQAEAAQPYYQNLMRFLTAEYAKNTIYPPSVEILSALKHTPFGDVKVVILGQDPYIGPKQAHGMAFSVTPDAKIPPSLRNIFVELESDIGCRKPDTGYLMPWARQGVLLLNTILTAKAGQSKSHANKGWEQLTDAIISRLDNREHPIVFMLWGNDAKTKATMINHNKHKVLTAAHPSPLARGKFFGCRHFSQANTFLEEYGYEGINWQL